MELTIIAWAFMLLDVIQSNRFPFNDFFEYQGNFTNDDMARISKFSCGEPTPYRYCGCDENCMQYQQCCIDYLWDVNTTISLSDYVAMFVNQTKKYKQVQCTPIVTELPLLHTAQHLLMVSYCPQGSTVEIVESCAGKLKLPPVLGSDGYIYRNKYCASCHQVGNYTLLSVTAECQRKNSNSNVDINDIPSETESSSAISSENVQDILTEYTSCNFLISSKQGEEKYVKSCNRVSTSNCSTMDTCLFCRTTECRLCRSYHAGVSISQAFDGFHCCGSGKPNTLCYDVFSNYFVPDLQLFFSSVVLPRYSMLVSFSEPQQYAGNNGDKSCNDREYYDRISQRCIEGVSCGFGYVLRGTSCVKPGISLATRERDINHENSTKETILDTCLTEVSYLIINRKYNLQQIIGNSTVVYQNHTHSTFMIVGKYLKNILNNSKHLPYYSIVKTSSTAVQLNEMYGPDFTRYFSGNRVCASPIIHRYRDYRVNENCRGVTTAHGGVYSNDFVILASIKNWTTHRQLITCQQFHLNKACLLRSLRNYTILPNNTVVSENNTVYSSHDYTPFKDDIKVCILVTSHKAFPWLPIIDAVNGYTTVIGCTGSIMAYMWVITTYGLIRELRTVNGKNIICLCLMLMFCDILMLVTIAAVGCKQIAILLHLFALSAQCWTVVMAFNIWMSLSSKYLLRTKSQKRFRYYCIFGFACPLCTVLLNIILNETEMVDVGYGNGGICWIGNLTMQVASYIVPVALMLSFTVFFLCHTILNIYKERRKAQSLLNKDGGGNINLARTAIKLALLLGVIEVCGFFQTQNGGEISVTFNAIFRLLYSLLRSLRGVFIWLLYIATKRIFQVYGKITRRTTHKASLQITSASNFTKSRT